MSTVIAGRNAHLNIQMREIAEHDESQRPSIFDILAQESLMSGFKPAVKYAIKFGASLYPHLFRHLVRYFDEYFMGFELLLHDYYLKYYSASYAENFYGLKRILRDTRENLPPSGRFRSLCFLVIIPYVKAKLDVLLEKINEDADRLNSMTGFRRKLAEIFVLVYPKLCACLEFWTLVLQVGYLIYKSDIHSPWLYMAGVILCTASGDEFSPPDSDSNIDTSFGFFSIINRLLNAVWNRAFGFLCRMLGIALLFIQFLDWWHNNERDKKFTTSLPIPGAPHNFIMSENSVLKMEPKLCPLCSSKRKNDTVLAISGYVFCYSCISRYVKQKKCCPVTKLPASTEHLIRLFHHNVVMP